MRHWDSMRNERMKENTRRHQDEVRHGGTRKHVFPGSASSLGLHNSEHSLVLGLHMAHLGGRCFFLCFRFGSLLQAFLRLSCLVPPEGHQNPLSWLFWLREYPHPSKLSSMKQVHFDVTSQVHYNSEACTATGSWRWMHENLHAPHLQPAPLKFTKGSWC